MTSKVLFHLVIKPLSKWPLEKLYLLSTPLYTILRGIVRYRRKVVRTQLHNSFPEKSARELIGFEKGFYYHLSDLILEIIRSFSISREEVVTRCRVTNPELFEEMRSKGKNLILVGGHYNNWEMLALALPSQIPYKVMGLYKPLRDPFFNQVMKESRGKYDLGMITKAEFKSFLKDAPEEPFAIIFGADQSPTYSKNVYWMEFLNQKTPVAYGTEYYARECNLAVLYGIIEKKSRGFYEITFSLISEEPNKTPYGAITEAHTKLLENSIRKDPTSWIWTHKRWKRR